MTERMCVSSCRLYVIKTTQNPKVDKQTGHKRPTGEGSLDKLYNKNREQTGEHTRAAG